MIYRLAARRSVTHSSVLAVKRYVHLPRPTSEVIKKLIQAVPDSLVATVSHDQYQKRRAAMDSFFSKASIWNPDPAVQNSLVVTLRCLQECAINSDVFHASIVYKAAIRDIEFSFGESTTYAAKDDYEVSYLKAVDDYLHLSWLLAYIAWFRSLMVTLPLEIMGRL